MTAIDYVNSAKAYRSHRRKVSLFRNRGEHAKVIAECELAFDDFDKYGWVDNWALFVREAEDVLFKLQTDPGYKDLQARVNRLRSR